jgi:hypothetical protein
MRLYAVLHKLLNVLVQIAIKMGLQKSAKCATESYVRYLWRKHVCACYVKTELVTN